MKNPGNPPMETRVKRMRHASYLIALRPFRHREWSIDRIAAASGAERQDVVDLAMGRVIVSERGHLVYRGDA